MDAKFSDCRTYRYRLDRTISLFGPPVAFLLHNPSTAGNLSDDPTSRRGIGFAQRWGNSRLTFVNVWAGIATRPADLWLLPDPVGPLNDQFILEVATEMAAHNGVLVLAHGVVSPPKHLKTHVSERMHAVHFLVRRAGCELRCLSLNKDGSPKHPLYVPYEVDLQPYLFR